MLKKFVQYFKYIYQVKWSFIAAILSGLVAASASGLGIPVIAKKVFPIISGEEPAPEWISNFLSQFISPEYITSAILWTVCLLLPFIFAVRGLAMFVNGVLVSSVGMRVLELLRLDVFRHMQILPLSFHEKRQKGDLISRVLSDTNNVQIGITSVANDLIRQPATAISATGALIWLLHESGQMGMILTNFVILVLVIWPIYYFGKKVVEKSRRAQIQLGAMTSVAQENLASQREIRSYALEDYQTDLFLSRSQDYLRSQLKTVKYRQFLAPSIEFITALGLAYILVVGRSAGLAVGDFIAIAMCIYFAFDSMKKLGLTHNRFKQAQASLERLDAILREPDTMPDPEHPIEPESITGDVRFDHVSFSYNDGEEVLSDINVHIPAGQVVGLVGPSGAGKTTFASLILRFYEVSKGAILIDGIDIRKMRKCKLRSFIALVAQHALLFRNTIMENIRLGKQGSSDEEVLEAAKDASVLSFAAIQPQGINTMLGDGGEGLSGGQRQRVAIARAFLKNAPILILDEATASLDAESEQSIQQSLQKLSRGRTTFIVAHRFSTIRHADRILVFQNGKIVGDGPHEKLYATVPLYKELYDKQSL